MKYDEVEDIIEILDTDFDELKTIEELKAVYANVKYFNLKVD